MKIYGRLETEVEMSNDRTIMFWDVPMGRWLYSDGFVWFARQVLWTAPHNTDTFVLGFILQRIAKFRLKTVVYILYSVYLLYDIYIVEYWIFVWFGSHVLLQHYTQYNFFFFGGLLFRSCSILSTFCMTCTSCGNCVMRMLYFSILSLTSLADGLYVHVCISWMICGVDMSCYIIQVVLYVRCFAIRLQVAPLEGLSHSNCSLGTQIVSIEAH